MKNNSVLIRVFNMLFKKRIDKYIERRVNHILDQKFGHYYKLELWEAAKIKGETSILKVLNKELMFFCSLDSVLDKMIFTNEFENDEILFLNRFLKPGDQFIDIGANSGLFTIYAAQKVGSSGKVFSFEPTETTFKKLCKNIELNKYSDRITPFQLALSSKNEDLMLYSLSEGFDAWNSVSKPIINKDFKVLDIKAVQIDRLDEIGIDFNNSALVKIDIEGWELNALKGGAEWLKKEKAPVLMIEFAEEHAVNSGSSCRELYSFIESLGYRLYKYEKMNNDLVPAPNLDYYYENIIAAKLIDPVKERLKID